MLGQFYFISRSEAFRNKYFFIDIIDVIYTDTTTVSNHLLFVMQIDGYQILIVFNFVILLYDLIDKTVS